jgi:hypothetical protein
MEQKYLCGIVENVENLNYRSRESITSRGRKRRLSNAAIADRQNSPEKNGLLTRGLIRAYPSFL